jgi:lipopolysaccharide transport system ATP-binding protein
MAEDVVICAERLGKKYLIGHAAERERYVALRDVLVRGAHNFWRKAADMARGRAIVAGDTVEEFWALKDVSFEVKRGEVLGIIGRNGAGKSTLLKVLSRITEPTKGQARLRGRVASLLEVGTGFHPELTGRENIYLNGSILGMRKGEIDRKFDEIVAFAEVEKFLDTPVKHYSSGMYVRLAFSVAAHLEPEILVVDEVLAVGDAEFQKKCLGKMRDVSEGDGRTVLFVSHNMNAMTQLCGKAILLRQGRLVMEGPALDVVQAYASHVTLGDSVDLTDHPNRDPARKGAFRRIEMLDADGHPKQAFAPPAVIQFRVQIDAADPILSPKVGIGVNNWRGDRVFAVATYLSSSTLPPIKGERVVAGHFELPYLVPGRYSIDIGISDSDGHFIDAIYSALAFEVLPTDYLGTTQNQFDAMGSLLVRSRWWLTDRDGRSPSPLPD